MRTRATRGEVALSKATWPLSDYEISKITCGETSVVENNYFIGAGWAAN